MTELTKKEKQALKLLKDHLLAAFGHRLDATRIFGSAARGEATKHSDVDVLVTLSDASWQDRHKVSDISADILLDTGVVLSTKTFTPYQIKEMKKHQSMFWQSIEPDLISI